MKAEDYVTEWCDKTYKGGKELGDWTTKEVMKFANDFAININKQREILGSYHTWLLLHPDKPECRSSIDEFLENNI